VKGVTEGGRFNFFIDSCVVSSTLGEMDGLPSSSGRHRCKKNNLLAAAQLLGVMVLATTVAAVVVVAGWWWLASSAWTVYDLARDCLPVVALRWVVMRRALLPSSTLGVGMSLYLAKFQSARAHWRYEMACRRRKWPWEPNGVTHQTGLVQ